MARIDRIEYVTADELGDLDTVTWIAEEFAGMDGWDGRDFALLAVSEPIPGRVERSVRTYLTEDIAWARMLESALRTGQPVTLTPEVVAEKLPVWREGWVFADLDHATTPPTDHITEI
ncbi:hypothetical protein AB0B04_18975 [Streptomyces xinghaiensis]|uniref:Uncharacterized protein n=2 Tax=Streptomyces TaxID=1883 RepID=A0A420UXX5_9ACTN|nr:MULTISPECIES: hypothetical protein [Streptomyces]KNE83290.1 hypothetical protein ADZ36_05460 [Streptomyces fradiae]OFA36637.1 hypothetical protein BEN35_29720 [Streptomyces fradiae]PQM20635.1 hypothetical protein Sfr7A_25965 [Streptomyces xinghaiensis]RKM92576.1 hypothetical protein SFRA_024620 [Streptomyces xinghaiensis]RNC70544.1 hypothetical protein DC095_025610 [Streptomyces xinghaiensis]